MTGNNKEKLIPASAYTLGNSRSHKMSKSDPTVPTRSSALTPSRSEPGPSTQPPKGSMFPPLHNKGSAPTMSRPPPRSNNVPPPTTSLPPTTNPVGAKPRLSLLQQPPPPPALPQTQQQNRPVQIRRSRPGCPAPPNSNNSLEEDGAIRAILRFFQTRHEELAAQLEQLEERLKVEQDRSAKLLVEVEEMEEDKKQLVEAHRIQENHIEFLNNEMKVLRQDELKRDKDKDARNTNELKAANEELTKNMSEVEEECEKKLAELRAELEASKERCRRLEEERSSSMKDVEERWLQLWEKGDQRMEGQLEKLKALYEAPLHAALVREQKLQDEIVDLKEDYSRSRRGWEESRTSLTCELQRWRELHTQELKECQDLRKENDKCRRELEEKEAELQACQELVATECTERGHLQAKLEWAHAQLRKTNSNGSRTN